ncbi:MAG: FG-GAP-like repeat-containing protein, partial [Myxococcota bacterium]|nr:FG-GAP-like repeat-containing protein [Myxococcota bacterium]
MGRILPFLLLAACSDYALSPKTGPEAGTEDELPAADRPADTGTPTCPDTPPETTELAVAQTCVSDPEVGAFEPVIEWQWTDNPVHPGYHQLMAQPVVANLTDDNEDGRIDDGDIPDIVVSAFGPTNYRSPGVLVAISGADGTTLWSTEGDGIDQPQGTSGLAVADVDGTGPSVFGMSTGGLTRYDAAGTIVWTTSIPAVPAFGHGHPAIGDLDGDGSPEIIIGPHAVAAEGRLLWSGAGGTGSAKFMSFPVDVDGDGVQEVVAGNTLYESDGRIRWITGLDGYGAVADLDLDGVPEVIVAAQEGGELRAMDIDGNVIWTYSFTDRGGGPPTIADYDGDGFPEIGLASEQVYRVLEHD